MLHRRLSVYLTAQLGSQALNLRLAEHTQVGSSPDSGRVQAPILRRLDAAYVDNLRNAHSNQFYKLRVASGLLLLEAILLLLQGRRKDMDQRFLSEVMAASLTSAAAGFELLAVGTEQALNSMGPNSAAARGAQISLGRYRLWGAGLAAAGGLVSIWWDVEDATAAFNKASDSSGTRNHSLVVAYGIRAAATLTLLIGQGGIAFSQAGAYFNWLAMQARTTRLSALFHILAYSSTRLAANQTAMLLLSRMTWIGGVIVLGATIVLLILDENALEKWCDRCCYSRDQAAKRYASAEEELSALFGAIEEVL
jgi:hypothetical protein